MKNKEQRLKEEQWKNFYNDDVELISQYINRRTNVQLKCKHCGYTYWKRPDNPNISCPACTKSIFFNDLNTFDNYLQTCWPEYKALTKYINGHSKMIMFHEKCKRTFELNEARYFISGTRCPYCKENKLKKDLDDYREEVKQLQNNEYELADDNYVNNTTHMQYKHLICGKTFTSTPTNFKAAVTPCPYCRVRSSGEMLISKYLQSKNILYEQQKRFDDLPKLSFDFYLPNDNVAIEYDGIQHFQEVSFGCKSKEKSLMNFLTLQKNDNIKTQYCKDNNIRLLRIPYTEKDILQQKIDEFL